MKLKLVVASMSLLGLISCPVLADTQATTTTTTTTATDTPAPVKHKHHHRHHHVTKHYVVEHHDYKDMGTFKDAALPVVVCPRVDPAMNILDGMSHNLGRAKATVHCMDPISLAGGMNFDSTWGNRHQGYSGENTARFSLNDAYVNVYGIVNDWTTAFASISYSNFQPFVTDTQVGTGHSSGVGAVGFASGNNYLLNGIYSASYTHDSLNLEQGFVTFKNMDVLPVFVRVGKMFTDFGRYDIHPMTESFTQVMSESLKTQAQLGFITQMGFNGSVYTFENPMSKNRSLPLVPATAGAGSDGHNMNNYGASLNFDMPSDTLGWGVGVGYMYDFTGVDQIAYGVETFNSGFGPLPTVNSTLRGNLLGQNGTYQSRVSGGTVYADVNSGPFALNFHYVTAMQSFNALDLPTRTQAAINAGGSQTGAKPWSGDITGAYGFNAWGHDQNIYIGYQASGNAVNLYLPRSRWLAGYGIGVWKNTNLGIQWNHDLAYSSGYGGSGTSSNGVLLRAGVTFG